MSTSRRKRFQTPMIAASLCAGLAAVGVFHFTAQDASAHCQVPCGIYDDAARIAAMQEDATTIGKAIILIGELSAKSDAQSLNQAVRWVNTKEAHASKIITTVSEYFLTQKVKPVAPDAEGYKDYLQKLADHHAVLAAAMKTKQNVDPKTVDALNKAIAKLAKHYDVEGHDHGPAHTAAESHAHSHGGETHTH